MTSVTSNPAGDVPVLYTYFRSSCSWRVRIALNLKGIKYRAKFVNLLKGEQSEQEYASVNPQKLVPSLVIGGAVLTQSVAILEYLDEAYPDMPLLPKDAIQRAQVRALVQIVAADTQPIQNLRVLQYVGESKKAEWAKHWITSAFKVLETQLVRTAGRYCFGNSVTQADVCLVPQVYGAKRWGVDMTSFPTIERVTKNLEALEAFKEADWQAQEDCPADLKEGR